VDNRSVSRRLPEELSDPSILQLFQEVAGQNRRRGWALLLPVDLVEMGRIHRLVDSGLIVLDSAVHRFDLSGRAKSAEVVCQLTEAGKLAATAVLGTPND
jgi:hypothetical protein